jgi:hypothetical protein
MKLCSRIVNLATGALMVLGGVSQFFPEVSVRGTICALYIILFGLGNALLGSRRILAGARLG